MTAQAEEVFKLGAVFLLSEAAHQPYKHTLRVGILLMECPTGKVWQFGTAFPAALQQKSQFNLVVYAAVVIKETGLEIVQVAVRACHDGGIHGKALHIFVLRYTQLVDYPRTDIQLKSA